MNERYKSMKQIIILLIAAASTSCGTSKVYDINKTYDAETIKKIETAGVFASNMLIKTLMKNLLEATSDKDYAGAIEFCSTEALPLTNSLTENLNNIVEVKRTSFKYRNPANKPDEFEVEALNYFINEFDSTGWLPDHYLQGIQKNGLKYAKYYKPLRVMGLCLNCHGSAAEITPDTRKTIDQIYPDDLARDYKVKDFRGVISIMIDPAGL